MNNYLNTIISTINDTYKENIAKKSRHYIAINIGKFAEQHSQTDIPEKYRIADIIVPLKKPVDGMKVRIDGRTFGNYSQFDSGIAVPGYIARQTNMAHQAYHAEDSMILNVA